METLLILIGIVVLDAVIKGAAKKRKQQQQLPPRDLSQQEQDADEEPTQGKPPRSLQDLIRQFEEAQREASQGTYVPPSPPVDDDVDEEEDEEDLPVVQPANPGHFSFMEIAESVIQWEEVSVEYLQQAFGFSESTAAKVLAELQNHRIVGHDMGDGFCDVLVHDKVELSNLFKREKLEAEKRKAAEKQAQQRQCDQDAANAEMERQRKLNELEARAREARENAGTDLAEMAASASGTPAPRHAPLLSTKNIADIRRGFLWAKVIDEPRFKSRWSARTR